MRECSKECRHRLGREQRIYAGTYLIKVGDLVEVWRDAAMDGEELAVDERRKRERVKGSHACLVDPVRVLVQA